MLLRRITILIWASGLSLVANSQNEQKDKWVGNYQYSNDHTKILIEIKRVDTALMYTFKETYDTTSLIFSGFCRIENNNFNLYYSSLEKGKITDKIRKSKPYYRIIEFNSGDNYLQRVQPNLAEQIVLLKRVE